MAKLNPCLNLVGSRYLFPEIEKRLCGHPGAPFLDLGMGEIARPLSPHLLGAFCRAVQEMGEAGTFRGLGPSEGYPFLREAIARGSYSGLGVSADEVFVSNGAKGDLAHIQELFANDCAVLVPDPAYPVYADAGLLSGKTVRFAPCLEETGFLPLPSSDGADLVYLASPSNATGAAMPRSLLSLWVEYAQKHGAVIVFDGAYEAYVSSEDCPRSIYEIEGAKECAVEIRSFSKTAGFSNLRCSYAIFPKELAGSLDGRTIPLHLLWKRRQDTKFGNVPYPVQRCAEAVYSPQGQREVCELVRCCQERAQFLLQGLQALGFKVSGGVDAPYVWCRTPGGIPSWECFDRLLAEARVISVPGTGFGQAGEGFIRLSAFESIPVLAEALLRLEKICSR